MMAMTASQNNLFVLKALTCLEGQSARALGHLVNFTFVASCIEMSRVLHRQRAEGTHPHS